LRASLVFALVATLAACSTQRAANVGSAPFVIGQQQEPTSLNPALLNGQFSTEWGELLFSYLVKFDDKGRLVGDVATEVPTLQNGGISADGLTITYHLRRGIRFADGTALTARDAAWSIEAIDNPNNNVQSRYGYSDVASVSTPTRYTLVLHLKQAFAPIVTLIEAPQGFPILPAHLLARYPNFNQIPFDSKPIGSGPYVVDDWVRGDRVDMHANPYYRPLPSIARLMVKFIPDPQEGTNQLETGEIEGYFNEQDYSQYPLLEALRGDYVLDTPVSAVGAMIFNTDSAATRDARVRHAIAEAIDMHAVVAKSYRGALQSRDAARGLFIWAFDPRAYPDVPYDPVQARALLDAAGWSLGPDGLRHKNGRTLTLLLIIQAVVPGEQIAASNIAQYEREVGIRVTIKQFNVTQFGLPAQDGGPVYGGKFDLALYSFVNGDDPDPTDQFACSRVPPNGYNKSRICDPRIDVLLREGRTTYDVARRAAIYRRLQALLYQELPIEIIYQRREIDAFTNRLVGPSGSNDSVFWNVATWRLRAAQTATP
jgi:peptide/nickel transport system substrate-binding protein